MKVKHGIYTTDTKILISPEHTKITIKDTEQILYPNDLDVVIETDAGRITMPLHAVVEHFVETYK